MDTNWNGITAEKFFREEDRQTRHKLADAAKDFRWMEVLALLKANPQLVNTSRPDGSSFYAPLHQAAYGGAPIEIVKEMIGMGAFRALQNVRGERPVDVAEVRNQVHLLKVLVPQYKHQVPLGVLLKIQRNFHEVILGRIRELPEHENLRLPELEVLLELEEPRMWFAVPGMYGGFNYHLEKFGAQSLLVVESWCRVVDGSGQRHEITSSGATLVEEGFV